MDQVQISEKVSIRMLNFIFIFYIDYHEKASPGCTVTFCITQPVAKEVKFKFSLNRPLGRLSLVVAMSTTRMKV